MLINLHVLKQDILLLYLNYYVLLDLQLDLYYNQHYAKHLNKIAEVLDTTTDYLLTGKTVEPAAQGPRSELIAAIMEEYQTATPEEQAQAYSYLLGLKAARKAAQAPQESDH